MSQTLEVSDFNFFQILFYIYIYYLGDRTQVLKKKFTSVKYIHVLYAHTLKTILWNLWYICIWTVKSRIFYSGNLLYWGFRLGYWGIPRLEILKTPASLSAMTFALSSSLYIKSFGQGKRNFLSTLCKPCISMKDKATIKSAETQDAMSFSFFHRGSHYSAQISLKLTNLLPQPPKKYSKFLIFIFLFKKGKTFASM